MLVLQSYISISIMSVLSLYKCSVLMMVLQSYISISIMSVLSLYKCSHDGVTKLHFYLHYVCIESLLMLVLQSYISISIMSVLSHYKCSMLVLQSYISISIMSVLSHYKCSHDGVTKLHFYLHYVGIESLQMFSCWCYKVTFLSSLCLY